MTDFLLGILVIAIAVTIVGGFVGIWIGCIGDILGRGWLTEVKYGLKLPPPWGRG
jgi:hypothetical protein